MNNCRISRDESKESNPEDLEIYLTPWQQSPKSKDLMLSANEKSLSNDHNFEDFYINPSITQSESSNFPPYEEYFIASLDSKIEDETEALQCDPFYPPE